MGDDIDLYSFWLYIFHSLRSNKYKAAIIRIDSPGGDALASDL